MRKIGPLCGSNPMSNNTPNKNNNKIIGILLLLIGGFLLFASMFLFNEKSLNKKSSASSKNISIKPNDILNEHLQSTYSNMVISETNTIHQNKLKAPSLEKAQEEIPYQEDYSVGFETDDLNANIGKDLKKDIQQSWDNPSLHEKINKEMQEEQQKQISEQEYREAFAKAYIQKAKEKGYEVELDDQYRVVSVKKIKPKKEPPSIFELDSQAGASTSGK